MIAGATAAVGIVTAALPSVAAAVSEAGPTTSVAPYSESGSADPSLAAINAVPVVNTSGGVDVTGSDSF